MKILLDVSAVTQPLSGIGRYGLELAAHLPAQPGVEEVIYLRGDHVQRVFDPGALEVAGSSGKWRRAIRRTLPYGLVLGPYRQRRARGLAHKLKAYSDYIFYSPNFSVPPVEGRSVVTVHDLSVFHFPRFHPRDRVNYIRDQIHHSVARADRVVTDSEFVRRELLELFGLGPERVVAIPLGVADVFRPRPDRELAPVLDGYGVRAGQYLLSVGTIEPRKNLAGLLGAYRQLEDSLRSRYPLVIAGAYGWQSGELLQQIQGMQAAGEVIYLDYIPERDLPALYAGAALFCYFSFYEGFGLPVLEAMSSGVPVVYADRSALPELCAGVGLAADPDDAPAMHAALQRALLDGGWRSSASRQGIARSDNYRWEQTAASLVAVFGELA